MRCYACYSCSITALQKSAVFIEEVINLPTSESYKEYEELSLIDNSDIKDLVNYSEFKKTLLSNYITCLADSSTTSHVFRDEGLFLNYWPIENMYVNGVGGTWSCVKGRGTVILIATHGTQKTKIKLQDVIHVPDARHNLISLRRWENENWSHHAQKGILTRYSLQGNAAIQGECVYNNLYWLHFQTNTDTDELLEHTFPTLPWEEWHCRYGHISYMRLQPLRDKNLVDGFNLDPKSPKQDCGPCIAAKMHHKAFPLTATWTDAIGHLTHIDLWGRYPVQSINGNQYYILMINDKSWYTTIRFLKQKSQATHHVQNYITHLNVCRHSTRAIRVNRGMEFLNNALKLGVPNMELNYKQLPCTHHPKTGWRSGWTER